MITRSALTEIEASISKAPESYRKVVIAVYIISMASLFIYIIIHALFI